MYKILLVDDDAEMLTTIEQYLRREGYQVTKASSAREALRVVERETPEMCIVNTYLPGMDGMTLCMKLRANPETEIIPIIFMGDPEAPYSVGEAINAGGDDYLRKPFALRELGARIRAHLRRAALYPGENLPSLRLLSDSLSVYVNDRHTILTQVEFDLLRFLCSYPNQLHSTQDLLMSVWEYPAGTGDAALVRNHIRNLRRKIEEDPERPMIIQSRHGRGYAVRANITFEQPILHGAR
jgi:DNA-binding response OmpR family regulator